MIVKNDDRNAFLHDFELRESEVSRADTIGRHLEKIFKKREEPACTHHQPKRLVFEFQMPIPRERHKNIRDKEQQSGDHDCSISRLKLCRYRLIRFETAPPKLEVSFKVTHVLWSESGAKETTPAAK